MVIRFTRPPRKRVHSSWFTVHGRAQCEEKYLGCEPRTVNFLAVNHELIASKTGSDYTLFEMFCHHFYDDKSEIVTIAHLAFHDVLV